MSIFTGHAYDMFINDKRVKNALVLYKDGIKREFSIFNKTDIINHFINVDREECFDEVLSGFCDYIGNKYLKASFSKVFDEDSDFDILAIAEVSEEYKNEIHEDDNPLKFTSFLITELGECRSYPDTVALNIICSNGVLGSSLLLAAYLYMIKGSEYEHEGLLDLANGFKNTSGLCAYGKFGFKPNMIRQRRCTNNNNLCMVVDIDKVFRTYDDILNVFAEFPSKNGKTVPSFQIPTDPLCNEFNPKKNNPNKYIIPNRYIHNDDLRKYNLYHENPMRMVHPLYITQRKIAHQSQIRHVMKSHRDDYPDTPIKENDEELNKTKQLYKSQIKDVYKKADEIRRSYIGSIPEEEQEVGTKKKRRILRNESISNVHRPNKFAAMTDGKIPVPIMKKRRTRKKK